jgi:DNA-binding NarL/FixJ family response regulator
LIRVGLVAPSLAARLGLRALLENDPELVIEADANSSATLAAGDSGLEVLVLMAGGAAANPLADLTNEQIEKLGLEAVLMLADDIEAAQALPELPLRAWGLLPVDTAPEELAMAVHALALGLVIAPPDILTALYAPSMPRGIPQATETAEELLTEREVEVLQLLAQGLANKQIAQLLNISANTVKFHVSSIYTKLGATNRTEAVRLGLQSGLILL